MVPTRLRSAAALLALVVFGVGLAGSPAAATATQPGGKGKSDQELFQGKWEVMSAEKGGMEIPEEFQKGFRLTVKGDKITVDILGESKEATFKLDPSKKPRAIDLTFEGKSVKGIYEFKGTTLRVCVPLEEGADRPKEFKSEGETILATFRRPKEAKGGKKAEAKEGARGDLQGTWVFASVEKGGAKVADDIVKSVRITLAEGQLRFEILGETRAGSYTIDPASRPRTIDFTVEGKTALGSTNWTARA